ncbi:unnamed protein product [Caenorhabditis angaria]|uniref:Uncharacterized protein n=1 Tax=Caenorhabditis angaria TaxID=860376 RepID=A0A9P1N319_9PELO|nr:unnamed protein product [Caenorhabditis angaria]
MTTTRWNIETLLGLAQRYILKTRLSPNHVARIKKSYPKNEILCNSKALEVLQSLIEKSGNNLEIYGTPEELLKDLETFGDFPMNAEFHGLGPDCLNYLESPKCYWDQNGNGFMSKMDVFLNIYGNLSVIENDGDELLNELLMSWGNRFYRKLKNFYRFVSLEEAEEITRDSVRTFKNCSKNDVKFDSIDVLFSTISKFFDSTFDKTLMEKHRKSLLNYKKTKPFSKNHEFYKEIYQKHQKIDNILKNLINQPIFEESYGSRVCRIFDDEGNMFMMKEEVEIAIGRRIDEGENLHIGFLETLEVEKFEKLLNEFEIKKNDIHLVSQKIIRTERNIGVSIITPRGTHCKLAIDAFSDIFEYLSSGLRLFESSDFDKSKLRSIYEWFKEELDIYGGIMEKDSRNKNEKRMGRFFVEIWKIEKMIEKMKDKFGNEKVLIDSKKLNKKNRYNKIETVKIISSITNNILNISDEVVNSRFLYFSNSHRMSLMTPMLIYRIYEYCAKIGFISGDDDCRDFICKQGVCRQQLFRGFSCYCNMLISTNLEETKSTHHIKFMDIFKYCVVAENGEKYFDNDTCLLKTLDLSVINLTLEDQEIARAIYREQYSEMKRIFYLDKEETMQFVKDNTKQFNDQMLKISSFSYDCSKKSIIKWSDIPNEFAKFSKNLIVIILNQFLKNLEKATKVGIPSDVIAQLKKKCTFFQFFYNKCAQNMSNLAEFTKICHEKKERRCILRTMAKCRVDRQSSWHCFIDELLEFVQVYSDVTKGTDILIETIERYQLDKFDKYAVSEIEIDTLNMDENFAIIKKLVIFVPDIEFMQCSIKLPLKMGYGCVKVQAPNRKWVYHHIQAKFILFQCTACDVDLFFDQTELSKNKRDWKDELMLALKIIPQGYISTNIIDGLIKKCMNCVILRYSKKVHNRVALNIIHDKQYNELISLEEVTKLNMIHNKNEMNQFLKNGMFENSKNGEKIEIWKARYIFMMNWIENFMREDEKLKYEIKQAYTFCLPYLIIENHADWVNWMTKNYLKSANRLFDISKFEQCVVFWKKSEEKNFRFKETDLVEKHHWDTQKYDTITHFVGKSRMLMPNEQICESMREEQILKEKIEKTNNDVLGLLMNQVKLTTNIFSSNEFKPIQCLKNLLEKQFSDWFVQDDQEWFDRIFEDVDFVENFCEKFKNVLEFRTDEHGNREFREKKDAVLQQKENYEKQLMKTFWPNNKEQKKIRKETDLVKEITKQARKNEKKIEPVIMDSPKKTKKQIEKKEKQEKKVITVEIEKRIVEVCEFCDSNKTDLMRKTRRIDELERQNGQMTKEIEDLHSVVGNLKGQLTETRTKYRTESKNLKKDCENKEERICQLQNEIEQNRKESREERDNLSAEERKERRKMENEMTKMRNQLENLKFLNNTMTKQLIQKSAENDDLKIQLEIEKERNQESL